MDAVDKEFFEYFDDLFLDSLGPVPPPEPDGPTAILWDDASTYAILWDNDGAAILWDND